MRGGGGGRAHHHGAEGHGGQGALEDGDGVEGEPDAEHQRRIDRRRQQHRIDPGLGPAAGAAPVSSQTRRELWAPQQAGGQPLEARRGQAHYS